MQLRWDQVEHRSHSRALSVDTTSFLQLPQGESPLLEDISGTDPDSWFWQADSDKLAYLRNAQKDGPAQDVIVGISAWLGKWVRRDNYVFSEALR